MKKVENRLVTVFLDGEIWGKVVCTKAEKISENTVCLYQKDHGEVSIGSDCIGARSFGIKFLDDDVNFDGKTSYSIVAKEIISLVGKLYTHMMTAGDTGYFLDGFLVVEDGGDGDLKIRSADFDLIYNVETKIFGCNRLYVSDERALSRAEGTVELIISKINRVTKGYPLSSITILPSYKGNPELFLIDSLETEGEYALYCGTSESLYSERTVRDSRSKVFMLKGSNIVRLDELKQKGNDGW